VDGHGHAEAVQPSIIRLSHCRSTEVKPGGGTLRLRFLTITCFSY